VSRTRISLLAALAVSLGTLSVAQAQDDIRARGDKACRHDAPKLCKSVLGQGDMAVLSCFQQNRTRLSASCRKFLVEVGQLN
jgi:hypothetical protein